MKKYHILEKIHIENDILSLTIDGTSHQFHLAEISDNLAGASDHERKKFEVSPSGYGIHWPLIDEDLSIDGLLGVRHSPNIEKDKAVA